ncbi:hypothetical protein CCAN12_480002 [Capnocytophaga canimorsus]|uniref:Uncharacterized protein n=1 Tax=Capnocytophaga canimorsus TaxID=28188 RepID=A0A0B7H7F5_9FLAO|nr:hypothetical protein [Capnocytophaga canimorsus]CEN33847.1 hypothetical protein CCAN12_480002 [Capnocytophaga canimorsus]
MEKLSFELNIPDGDWGKYFILLTDQSSGASRRGLPFILIGEIGTENPERPLIMSKPQCLP